MSNASTLDSGRTSLRRDLKVISLVSVAHGFSHFFQLVVPPLFPLLKSEFGLSYAALGLMMTVFYVTSGLMQTAAGFACDRFGARVVLLFGLVAMACGVLATSLASSYPLLLLAAALTGMGNSVFHPADMSLLNAKIDFKRLGHAFSAHLVTGNVGYVLAPLFSATLAERYGWRTALMCAAVAGLIFASILATQRILSAAPQRHAKEEKRSIHDDVGLLMSPPVLMSFVFFMLTSAALVGYMTFGPTAVSVLYGLPMVGATSVITAFLIGGIAGTLTGGVLASRSTRHGWIAAIGVSAGAICSLLLSIGTLPIILVFAVAASVGFFIGTANPSRDILVRTIAPAHSRGKVYGFVYSGLDAGAGTAPIFFGWLLDHDHAGLLFASAAAILLLAVPTVLELKRRIPVAG